MTDYSKLSDAELDQRLAQAQGGKPGHAVTDYSHLSDAELNQRLASAEQNKAPGLVQEMHPDFTMADRFVAKNFTNNNEAAVNYLQHRHPNLEIAVDDSTGQIKARARDGKDGGAYRVLDPDKGLLGNLNPTDPEFYRDMADVAYDVPSGLATGLATAAGGIAGAAAGAPTVIGAAPAALAGASAAGGAMSGGLELLRQKLGNALGVDQNTDWKQAGIATGAGAISPLLFGTGGQVAGKLGGAMLGDSLAPAARATLQQAQRGAIGYGADTVAKPALAKLGGFLSGAGDEPLTTLGKNYQQIEQLRNAPEGVLQFIDDTGKNVDTKFQEAKKGAWDEFQNAVGAAGDAKTVDLDPVKERFKAAIRAAEQSAKGTNNTEASAELPDKLKTLYQRYFVHDATEKVPQTVMQDTGILDAAGKPIMKEATTVTSQATRKELDSLSPKAALNLDRQLSDMADFQSLNASQVTGNRFSAGASAEDKKIANLGAELKKALGMQIDEVVPETALPARRRYGELANLENDINRLTQNPRQAFTNLRNADVSSNLTNKQLFHKVDRIVGTDLTQRAKIASATELFGPGRKSIFSGDLMRRMPAALAGGALGVAASGEMNTNRSVGGLGGMLLGGILGGPAAMRQYIKAGLNLGAANQALGPVRAGLGQEEVKNAWMGMKP